MVVYFCSKNNFLQNTYFLLLYKSFTLSKTSTLKCHRANFKRGVTQVTVLCHTRDRVTRVNLPRAFHINLLTGLKEKPKISPNGPIDFPESNLRPSFLSTAQLLHALQERNVIFCDCLDWHSMFVMSICYLDFNTLLCEISKISTSTWEQIGRRTVLKQLN